MKYNRLGTTELQVSAIGLGASSLGGGVFGDVEQADAIQTVRAALDCGVTLIDVAPFYGGTRAEATLGKALEGVPRNRYVLSTKVGRYAGDTFDYTPERVRRSLEESLERLRVDHVDILHIHDVEYGDLEEIASVTIPAARELVKTGRVRHIGASGYPLKALDTVVQKSKLDCVLSYNHCALNDTTLLEVLPAWTDRGIGVINAGVFSQGLLLGPELPEWHPAPPQVRAVCAEAVRYVGAQGEDPAKLAVQFASMQSGIACTLIGARSATEIEAAVRAAEEPLDTSLLESVLCILAPIHNLGWRTGRAENN